MTEYYIPANFEDSGKLLGIFPIRNVIEAAIVSLPIAYLVFAFVPLSLTWKIIIAATFVIPIGGFALIGINETRCPSSHAVSGDGCETAKSSNTEVKSNEETIRKLLLK